MNFTRNTCDAEHRKDSRIKNEDVKQLADWVEKQSHMPKVSDYILIQMLHVCNYSIQRAKDLTETYYDYRNIAPELFYDDSDHLRCSCDFWNIIYCILIPKPMADGSRLLYFGFRNLDTMNFQGDAFLKMYVRILMTLVLEQGICPGYVVVYDVRGYSLAHLASMSLTTMKKYICFSQEAIPLKVKSVYVINSHTVLDKIEKIIRPFMKKETTDMVNVYSSMEDVFKTVGREYMPSDLGGSLPHTREELNGSMKNRVNALSEVVTEELQLRIDESKRLVPKHEETLNMDGGSFRKLQVD